MRVAQWAAAVLYNGLARYDEAAEAARQVTANDIDPYPQMWALPELVEAASRVGEIDAAREAFERLVEMTQPAGTDWALGTQARSRALLSDGEDADASLPGGHRAVRQDRVCAPSSPARTCSTASGCAERAAASTRASSFVPRTTCSARSGWRRSPSRARRELAATGEKVRQRSPEIRDELTAQEEQIARLARDGLSNREIGAMLYLSSRTVEWHLRKVFAKLGISSRNQLGDRVDRQPGSRSRADGTASSRSSRAVRSRSVVGRRRCRTSPR